MGKEGKEKVEGKLSEVRKGRGREEKQCGRTRRDEARRGKVGEEGKEGAEQARGVLQTPLDPSATLLCVLA